MTPLKISAFPVIYGTVQGRQRCGFESCFWVPLFPGFKQLRVCSVFLLFASDHSPSAGGNDDSDDDEVLPPLSARSVIVSPPSARSLRQFDFSTRVMPDVKVGNFTKV